LSEVDDWAPVLTGLWAEHETLDMPTRRLRWQMQITCAGTRVDAAGRRMRPGPDQSAELWTAWEKQIVTFADLDGTAHTVRVATIAEEIDRGGDSSSTFRIGLVQV
jgi:hypothetical protein